MMEPQQYERLFQCEEKMWWFVGMRRIAETLLAGRLRPGLRCLEAGCGTGFNAQYYARRYGWEVFPFDLAADALRYAERRGLQRLARAALTHLPYGDASFDCATCLDVLVSLDQEQGRAALKELGRVLKPGGFLLLRTAAHEWMRGRNSEVTGERRRYRLGELVRAVTGAGLRVERSTYANFLLMPAALLKRKVLEPLGLASLEGDVRPVAPWLDGLCLTALLAENRLLRKVMALPMGVSALVVATRPDAIVRNRSGGPSARCGAGPTAG